MWWLAALALACSGSSRSDTTAPAAKRTYNATATVGDFLVITVDADTKTIAYDNRTTGESGTVPYTVAGDGSYLIADPQGKLVQAYEVPGLALVLQADKHGAAHDQPALIVAFQKATLTKADLKGRELNFLQFRTTEGGMEMGHIEFDASSGDAFGTNYRPAEPVYRPASSPYFSLTIPAGQMSDDAATGAVNVDTAKIFGTPGKQLAFDLPAGSLIAFPQAASKAFDATNAGTYQAIVYSKLATLAAGGGEAGTAQTGKGTLSISAGGHIRLVDEGGRTVVDTDLVPFEDSGLYGQDKVTRPCHGMFVFQAGRSLVFATFMQGAIAFAKFEDRSAGGQIAYDYAYGFGLRR
jgi:hypothetical protein